jgi:hypothetical protein
MAKQRERHATFTGPSPVDSRLRDGAKQVQDPDEALRMARESLARVERELAGVSDESQRASLEKKKGNCLADSHEDSGKPVRPRRFRLPTRAA